MLFRSGWNKVSAGSSFKAKQTVVLYLPKRAKAAGGTKAARGVKASDRTSGKVAKGRVVASKGVARGKTSAVVKKPRKNNKGLLRSN